MDNLKIYESGILKKGEEISDKIDCGFKIPVKSELQSDTLEGILIITDKRLIFAKKPGWLSKGLEVTFHCSLGNVLSVSTSGIIMKQINLNIEKENSIENVGLRCSKAELFSKKIIENKERFTEANVIEAQKVIIEEGKKDNAEEILKKKLSKGEITLEEFHERIQRI